MSNTPFSLDDFLKEAARRGLPKDRLTWIRYEKKGFIRFEKLPGGWRFFRSEEHIKKLLDQFEKDNIK